MGNVPVDTSAKKLQKLFRASGKIDKIWFRSICTAEESKKPKKAKILTKEFGNSKDSKNAYILYREEQSCQAAKLQFNQVLFEQRHLRVDTCGESLAEQGEFKKISRSGRNTCVNPWEDFTKTLFIGNLPFIVSEEEVRAQFADCGTIENVRLVRDSKTHLGKGIGYVMFSTKEEMQSALKAKKDLKFKGRELRINRAVEPKRREKKKQRKEAALAERRERRKQKEIGSDTDEELNVPRNIGDAYSSEDSEDEKFKVKKM